MFIIIDGTYAIGSDQHSWSIKKKRSVKDKSTGDSVDKWEAIRWYGTFEQTVKGLGSLMVRTSKAQTLGEAFVHVENVVTTLSHAMPDSYGDYARKK